MRSSNGVPDYFDRLAQAAGLRGPCDLPRGRRHAWRPGHGRRRAHHQHAGDAVVLPDPARDAAARPALHRQGSRGGLRQEGRPQLRPLAAAVRRPRRRARPRPSDQWRRRTPSSASCRTAFRFVDPDVQLWTPVAFTPAERADDRAAQQQLAAVRPADSRGAAIEQAQAQIDAINAANLERFPQFKTVLINAGFHTVTRPLHEDLVENASRTLYLLWGGVLCGAAHRLRERRQPRLGARAGAGPANWRRDTRSARACSGCRVRCSPRRCSLRCSVASLALASACGR